MGTERLQVFVCAKCGNMIESLRTAGGTLVCCDEPMSLLTENTTDAAVEKHVPVVEKVDGGIRVKVGEVAHPMAEDHHIEWIQVNADGKSCRQYLQPGDAPEAFFPTEATQFSVRESCNLHGLWKTE